MAPLLDRRANVTADNAAGRVQFERRLVDTLAAPRLRIFRERRRSFIGVLDHAQPKETGPVPGRAGDRAAMVESLA